jgi:hypothetical protein
MLLDLALGSIILAGVPLAFDVAWSYHFASLPDIAFVIFGAGSLFLMTGLIQLGLIGYRFFKPERLPFQKIDLLSSTLGS